MFDLADARIVKSGTAKWSLEAPLLSERGVWAIEYHRHGRPDAFYRRLPMPWITLVITLGAIGEWRTPGGTWRSFPSLAVRGHGGCWSEGRDDLLTEGEYLTAMIDPLSFGSIARVPAASLVGNFTAIEDLACLNSRIKLDELRNLPTPAEKMLAVARVLIADYQERPISSTVRFASAALRTGASVSQVAKKVSCSERHLRQMFANELGLSPKAWQRLARFTMALRMLHPQYLAAESAARDGFFDQSHFIHDFRHFSGMTPGQYAEQKSLGDPRLFFAT